MTLLKKFLIIWYLLEWMAVRRLLDRLKNSFIDTEKNGSAKGEKRHISQHTNQTEIGQWQEHA